MKYLYPIKISLHWDLIRQMMIEHYYKPEEHDNALFIIGSAAITPVSSLIETGKEIYGADSFSKVIVYQLEPLLDIHWHKPSKILNNIKGDYEIWDYDLDNIAYLSDHGIDAKYRPMKISSCLNRIKSQENPEIDMLFYGSFTEHRYKLLKLFNYDIYLDDTQERLFRYANMNFVWLHNIDGEKLDDYIARSKIILNLCPYENALQQQTRIFYALSNKKCVLSEKASRNYFGNKITEFTDPNDLYKKSLDLLMDDVWRNYTL